MFEKTENKRKRGRGWSNFFLKKDYVVMRLSSYTRASYLLCHSSKVMIGVFNSMLKVWFSRTKKCFSYYEGPMAYVLRRERLCTQIKVCVVSLSSKYTYLVGAYASNVAEMYNTVIPSVTCECTLVKIRCNLLHYRLC